MKSSNVVKIFCLLVAMNGTVLGGINIRNVDGESAFYIDNSGIIASNSKVESSSDLSTGDTNKSCLYFKRAGVSNPIRLKVGLDSCKFYGTTPPLTDAADSGDLVFRTSGQRGSRSIYYDISQDYLMGFDTLVEKPEAVPMPNYLRTTVYRTPQDRVTSVTYADGFGDVVQSHSQVSPFKYMVTGKYFNEFHQEDLGVLPFTNYSFGSYLDMRDSNLIGYADDYYNEKQLSEFDFKYSGRPYVQNKYDATTLGRISESSHPAEGMGFGEGHTNKVWYFGIESLDQYFKEPFQIKNALEREIFIEDIITTSSLGDQDERMLLYKRKVAEINGFTEVELHGIPGPDIHIPWISSSKLYVNLVPDIDQYYGVTYDSDSAMSILKRYKGWDVFPFTYEFNISDYAADIFGFAKGDNTISNDTTFYLGDYIPSSKNSNYHLIITRDKNGNYTQSVEDATGNVMLTWAYEEGPIITKYEYDAQGNLVKEISPMDGADGGSVKIRTEYFYDARNRLTKQITPDAAPVEIFYDQKDRVTHTKDGNITIYNRYDYMGRLDSVFIHPTYDNSGKLDSCDLLSRKYYNHVGSLDGDIISLFEGEDLETFNKIVGRNGYEGELKHLQGKNFASVIFNPSSGVTTSGADIGADAVIGLTSFDKYGQIDAAYSYYKPVGWKKISNNYDLLGSVTESKSYYEYNGDPNVQPDVHVINEYSFKGDLLAVRDGLTNNLMASYKHAETGELKEKTLYDHNGLPMETVTYDYNISGLTTRIKSGERFKEELYYYNYDGSIVEDNYNGSISRVAFTYNTGDANFNLVQNYSYDNVSRLKSVQVGSSTSSNDVNSYIKQLTEEFEYDKNGRFKTKSRGEAGGIQDFTYNYNEVPNAEWGGESNKNHRLSGVSGHHSGFEQNNYVYDANGNMIIDYSKNMAVYYNYQNLPVRFEFYEDVNELDINNRAANPVSTVDMVYDGVGNRISKTEIVDANENGIAVKFKKGTIYHGDFVYEGQTNDLQGDISYSLAYQKTIGGRIEFSNKKASERYAYVTDHLGSTRMTVNSKGDVVQSDLYTAYGEEIAVVTAKETKEKFTGKELDKDGAVRGVNEDGIDLNYFGWRYYDPKIAMWTSVDPLHEFWNEYSYTGGNPIKLTDPNGLATYTDESGVVVLRTPEDVGAVFRWDGRSFRYMGYVQEHVDIPEGSQIYFDFETTELFKDLLSVATNGKRGEGSYEDYVWALAQSLPGGYMDFVTAPNCLPGGGYARNYFMIHGIAYSPFKAGNYMWGASMSLLGFSEYITKLGAEVNALANGKLQNPLENDKPPTIFTRWTLPGTRIDGSWGSDNVYDSQAILRGHRQIKKMWK